MKIDIYIFRLVLSLKYFLQSMNIFPLTNNGPQQQQVDSESEAADEAVGELEDRGLCGAHVQTVQLVQLVQLVERQVVQLAYVQRPVVQPKAHVIRWRHSENPRKNSEKYAQVYGKSYKT